MLRALLCLTVFASIEASGCGGPSCTAGTLSIALTLNDAASHADHIRVTTTINGTSAVVETPFTGQTSVRAQLPDVAYEKGLVANVLVEARVNDAVVASASATNYAFPSTCAVLPLTLTDAGTAFSISGMLSGLLGAGLVLQDNHADDLSPTMDGLFAFKTSIASGTPYAVTVKTEPTTPTQTCTVMNGSGTIDDTAITDVTIECVTNRYTVGGSVTGLANDGLVLENNGLDDVSLTAASTSFSFDTMLSSGTPYSVVIKTMPTGQSCTITGNMGVVQSANITNIAVTCS